jgi:GWxTD domain-containing protein
MRTVFMILVVIATASCKSHESVSGRNISSLYRADLENVLDVQYVLSHKKDGPSELTYRIAPNSLFIAQDDSYRDIVSFSIRYRIYQNYSASEPIDSGYVVMKEVDFLPNHTVEGSIEIIVPSGRNHVVDVFLKDLGSIKSNRQYVDVFNEQNFTRQSIEVRASNGEIVFSDYIKQADSVFIQAEQSVNRLFVSFYDRDFPIAAPPFSAVSQRPFKFSPDKQTRLLPNAHGVFKLNVIQPGIYQVNRDSLSNSGGALYYFGANFPNARTVNDLLLPLRYITTSQEYEKISQGDNIKKNIDTYWLGVGGSPERAKDLLQEYYGRVEAANRLFSSYMEGWKTDRGMCYIVFGPPTSVYRSSASESWVYGEEGRYSGLNLTFTRVVNPFSNNDFRLNRNGTLKSPWYRSVEFWRQGRIITY